VPYVVILFNWILLVKDGHQKDTCCDEIGLCAQYRQHLGLLVSTVEKDPKKTSC
jgi:hypothetical protein